MQCVETPTIQIKMTVLRTRMEYQSRKNQKCQCICSIPLLYILFEFLVLGTLNHSQPSMIKSLKESRRHWAIARIRYSYSSVP